jgi:hypothetical protein
MAHRAISLRCGTWSLSGDIVAKVFLGRRTKSFRAADAFYERRREGPYRFIQNRSRISVEALRSDATAEKSKDQFSRDFQRRPIFDFCNSINGKADFPLRARTSELTQTGGVGTDKSPARCP